MATAYQFGADCTAPQIAGNENTTMVYSNTSNLICTIEQIETNQMTMDYSIAGLDTELIALYTGGALLLWTVGIGIGLIIAIVRRARI